MNHQPFEEWLLSDESLSPEEEQSLQAHLEICKECPQLSTAWQEVRAEIQRIPAISPAPGFSQRWEARLEAERVRQQRRLTWFLMAVSGLGAVALALLGVYQHFGHFPSPIELLSGLMYSITSGVATAAQVGDFLTAIFQSMPLVVPLVLWVLVASTLFIWTLIWIISVWRLPIIKRSVQA